MFTGAETRTLNSIIREHVRDLNGWVDLDAIAKDVADELDPDTAREVLVNGIRAKVAQQIAAMRPPAVDRSNGTTRSGRWDNVAEQRDKLDEWYVMFQDRGPKHLMDCSANDLEDAAEWYEVRADGFLARATAYRTLAKRMRKARKGSPADLNRDEVRRILNA